MSEAQFKELVEALCLAIVAPQKTSEQQEALDKVRALLDDDNEVFEDE